MDIRGPGTNLPKDPYEGVKVERVEREKLDKEKERAQSGKKNTKLAFLVWIQMMLFFNKVASLFISPKKEQIRKNIYESLTLQIESIKGALERLKTIDFSQDIQYLSYFSHSWHEFLENAAQIKRDVRFYPQLEKFIQDIQEYPSGQEHSLGYYLAEFAGSEWLPFPFMELLKKIHQEHIHSPHNSFLKKWTDELQNLILLIKTSG